MYLVNTKTHLQKNTTMKKAILLCLAAVALMFTFQSCKVETSKVTVYVEDQLGMPVANRYVLYTDLASTIIDTAIPDPTDPLGVDGYSYAQTNTAGYVTINIELAVKSLKYYFYVYDDGSKEWKEQSITLKRGENAELEFVVNR